MRKRKAPLSRIICSQRELVNKYLHGHQRRELNIALGRRRQRDIEPPLFASARKHNQIELTPVPRFLSLADPLYFRDPQTTQRENGLYTRAHDSVLKTP